MKAKTNLNLAGLFHINGDWLLSNPIFNVPLEFENLEGEGILELLNAKNNDINIHNEGEFLLFKYANSSQACLNFFFEDRDENLVAHFHFWHFLHNRNSYLDYSDSSKSSFDQELMANFSEVDSIPIMVKEYRNCKEVPCWNPFENLPNNFFRVLSTLLYVTFYNLEVKSLFSLFEVYLRGVPSRGALHPFEFYYCENKGEILPKGLYHYNTNSHSLSLIKEDVKNLNSYKSNLIFITAIYDRVQWRYRQSSAYKELFFDLGHLIGNVRYVADSFNVDLEFIEEFQDIYFSECTELNEDLMLCIKI